MERPVFYPANNERADSSSHIDLTSESKEINADSLWEDNHSPQASHFRQELALAAESGQLSVIHRCSDSRYILDPITIAIPTISAGGRKEPYTGIYNDPGTKNIIVLPHDPCGGLGVKEELAKNDTPEQVSDIAVFVKEEIHHHDPIIQAVRSARDVSRLTDKDVYVAIHTQENGSNHPIGVTYRNGKPIFTNGRNPEGLELFLQRNEEYTAGIAKEFPNLEKMQKTQNPQLLILSHNRRSAESAFPKTTRQPGSTFRILIPMPDERFIDPTAARRVIDQANYPISHFSHLKSVLIETDMMETSSWLLEKFLQRKWMKEWLKNPEHQLFLAQSTEGELIDIDQPEKALRAYR